MKRKDPEGIDERAYRFFCDVVAFVETVPIGPTTSRIIGQLVDAAGSIGSNREEALTRSSSREIVHFNEMSLRGASVSVRWLLVPLAGVRFPLSAAPELLCAYATDTAVASAAASATPFRVPRIVISCPSEMTRPVARVRRGRLTGACCTQPPACFARNPRARTQVRTRA